MTSDEYALHAIRGHVTDLENRMYALQEENRELRKLLGLQQDNEFVDQLAKHGITGHSGRLLSALYQADGRSVTFAEIDKMLPDRYDGRDRATFKVVIWRIRKKLGQDSVSNQWGVGYRLTPEGIARVDNLLGVKNA